MIVFMCWTKSADEETPIGLVVVMVLLFVSMIVGVLLALRQRLKEIDGGEINEARKY